MKDVKQQLNDYLEMTNVEIVSEEEMNQLIKGRINMDPWVLEEDNESWRLILDKDKVVESIVEEVGKRR